MCPCAQAAQRAGFPPTALAAFTQRQRPNPAGSSVKPTPQKHPKKASEALAGSIANLPLTKAGRVSGSFSLAAAGALAVAAVPEAGAAAPACSSGLPADMVALRIVKATCVKLQVEQLGKDFKERFGEGNYGNIGHGCIYGSWLAWRIRTLPLLLLLLLCMRCMSAPCTGVHL